MKTYQKDVETEIEKRQQRVKLEQNRLNELERNIEGEHQQFKLDLQRRREAFLDDFRRKNDVL